MSIKNDARASIADLFQTEFAAEYSSVPIRFENLPQDQPATAWVYFGIKWTERNQPTIGSTREPRRQWGFILVDVFVPSDSGTATLLQMTDFIEGIFDKQIVNAGASGTVSIMVSKTNMGGVINGYYEATVMVPFYIDTCAG